MHRMNAGGRWLEFFDNSFNIDHHGMRSDALEKINRLGKRLSARIIYIMREQVLTT